MKNVSSHAHRAGSWYLLRVHLRHFYMGSPPPGQQAKTLTYAGARKEDVGGGGVAPMYAKVPILYFTRLYKIFFSENKWIIVSCLR